MIPKIIHQIWKNEQLKPRQQDVRDSWRRHNRGYEYRLWTDELIEGLLASSFPEWSTIYHGYADSICRVDLARYLILYRFGGIYADLDYECLRPVDELLEGKRFVAGLEPESHSAKVIAFTQSGLSRIVCNAFIASEKLHPFWTHLFSQLRKSRQSTDVLDRTGPFAFTRALDSFPSRDISILAQDVLYPLDKDECWEGRHLDVDFFTSKTRQAFGCHYWEGNWFRAEASGDLALGAKTSAITLAPQNDALPEVLVLTPMKNCKQHLTRYFDLLERLDYPPEKLSLGILEGDSTDGTFDALQSIAQLHDSRFHRIVLTQWNQGIILPEPRWKPEIQLVRRAAIARARNRLLMNALREEEWVLWLDGDLETYPGNLLKALLETGKDIVVPHCVLPNGATFDLNTFCFERRESDTLNPRYMLDGLHQPPEGAGRRYLDSFEAQPLTQVDSVGGTALLVRANLHRDGLNFPCYSYKGYIETEGLAAMARDMGVSCWGLPQLRIVHVAQ